MPKAHEWREHLARCSESGGADVHDYCAKHGLQPKSLIWWRSELRRRERDGRSGHRSKKMAAQSPKTEKGKTSVKLAKVVRTSAPPVPPPSSTASLRISIAGAEVSVGAGCDCELLRTALAALREGVR